MRCNLTLVSNVGLFLMMSSLWFLVAVIEKSSLGEKASRISFPKNKVGIWFPESFGPIVKKMVQENCDEIPGAPAEK